MALEQKIMVDLKAAMLAKDEAALRSLRAIKAAILLAKTAEGATGELSEERHNAMREFVADRGTDILIDEGYSFAAKFKHTLETA